jgi:hypothetical protein
VSKDGGRKVMIELSAMIKLLQGSDYKKEPLECTFANYENGSMLIYRYWLILRPKVILREIVANGVHDWLIIKDYEKHKPLDKIDSEVWKKFIAKFD